MNYVGVDLHKQIIVWCSVRKIASKRVVMGRGRAACRDTAAIVEAFAKLAPFQVAVEATAAYEWFLELIESYAERVVLVHPRKMRIIAESRRKSDKLDAQILAEFLAADELPEAWRPTPRVRAHRTLVRARDALRRRISGLKCRIRNVLAHYNGDRAALFTPAGRDYLANLALKPADRFVVQQLLDEYDFQLKQRASLDAQLRAFAATSPVAEREAREVLESVPGIGPVTTEILLSELGDIRRFRSAADVAQYAGLAPGVRQSADKRRGLGISKEGSPLLRWAMIELAWRLESKTRRWGFVYAKLKLRAGSKKAIVAVARRILCVLVSMLKSGQRYHLARGECLGSLTSA